MSSLRQCQQLIMAVVQQRKHQKYNWEFRRLLAGGGRVQHKSHLVVGRGGVLKIFNLPLMHGRLMGGVLM
jgi:hypothetical protein